MLDILFMGTPDFAKASLEKIYEARIPVVGVVTNPDRQKNRGMKLAESEVKKFAQEKKLPLFQPENVKGNEEFIKTIKQINPDLICVVAYGKILPKEILEIPKFGCINLHASLLPKYRGAAPIQWAILNGDKMTGVSTMYMNEKMDEGDIIFQETTEIGEYETTGDLWEKLKETGAKLLLKTIQEIEQGTAPRIKQGENFSVAPMLEKQMAKIDFAKSMREIKNLVYGLNPIMGAYAIYQEKKIKFWKVEMLGEEETNRRLQQEEIVEATLGEVMVANDKIGLWIKVKDGIIAVTEIQGENAKRMNIFDFLRGNQIEEGKKFK